MPNASFPDLTGQHKRGIAATLAILDEALCEFQQWAEGRAIRSVFYSETNELSAAQREAITKKVSEIRKILRDIKESLQLEGRTRNASTSIWAQCSALWVNLVEIESGHLSRYGGLPSGFAEYMDPKVRMLIDSFDRISKLLKEH